MARTTNQPSTATRRNTGKTRAETNGRGPLDEQDQRDEDGQLGDNDERRENLTAVRDEQLPAMSAGLDTFAPVLEAWQQVVKSWSELAETMMKVQQDTFANMISAANTTAKDITLGDHRNGELAFSGSRTMASTPDRIERARR